MITFWSFIILLQLSFWADLKVLFFLRNPVVEMIASLCQDTIWLPLAFALPAYLLWLSATQLARWRQRLPAIILSLALGLWFVFDVQGFFRWMIFVALLFFIAMAMVFHRQRKLPAHVVLFLMAWVGVVLHYRGQLLPDLPRVGAKKASLHILDFSISGAQRGAQRQPVFDLIAREQPDVIFIQEINSGDRSLFSVKLGRDYPHQLWSDRYEYYNGGAILSKIPFIARRNIDLFSRRTDSHTNLNLAVIEWQGRQVSLLNCHLHPSGHAFIELIFGHRSLDSFFKLTHSSFIRRLDEAEQLAEVIENISMPIILAGDFNDTPHSPVYRLLQKRLVNAFEKRGWGTGATYGYYVLKQSLSPQWHGFLFDFLRIDHVFVSPQWRIEEVRVLPVAVSDHRPMRVVLSWH